MSPDVAGRGEQVEAHEVAAAVALPSEFACALVEDVLLRRACNRTDSGAIANLVELGNAVDTAHAANHLTFCQHQIDISQTEHGEVGVGEGIHVLEQFLQPCSGILVGRVSGHSLGHRAHIAHFRAVDEATVGLQVGEFREGIAALEVANVFNLLRLTVGVERGATVGSRELIDKFRRYADSAPAITAKSHFVVGHRAARSRIDDEGRAAVALRVDMVLIDAEDNLVAYAENLVVVGTEHLRVIVRRLQFVAQIDDFLAIFGAFRVVRSTRINACVQIEFCQNHIGHTLAGAIFLRIGRQLLCTFLHVLHEPVEQVGAADLLRIGAAHFAVFVHKRHIAEEVDGVQIAQSAQCTSLGAILLHRGIAAVRSLTNLAHHFVAKRNLIEHTAVGCTHEHVGRSPLQSVQILDGLVVPTDDTLVGGQFLHVEQGAQILAEATIDARNVGVAALAVGRTDRKSRIALGQQLVVCFCAGQHLFRRVEVGVDRRYVQIAHARVEKHGGSKGKAYNSNFLYVEFHILVLLLIKS